MNGQQNPQHPGGPQPQFEIGAGSGWGGRIGNWLKNNASILVPIIIIIILAGGIYLYTNRTTEILEEFEIEEDIEDIVEGNPEPESEEEDIGTGGPEEDLTELTGPTVNVGVFSETAQAGDGVTHLARRALARYLETNPDNSLSIEHKVYIEDHLRKTSNGDDWLELGDTRDFSASQIQQAIQKAKTLTSSELQNLQQYSLLVSTL